MIPLRDHNPSGSIPLVTYTLIAINVLVFVFMMGLDERSLESYIAHYALIPRDIIRGIGLTTLITSMFLHGGVGHIVGNMLFLHIFGDNIEDKLGPVKYLGYYLLCGLGASFLQILVDPLSDIPNLGASGAIAGVMGGYLLLFPKHRVDILFSFGLYMQRASVPAYTMLFYWFVAQLFSGVGSLAIPAGGGIAYFAHIGGFIAGYGSLLPFKDKLRDKSTWQFWER